MNDRPEWDNHEMPKPFGSTQRYASIYWTDDEIRADVLKITDAMIDRAAEAYVFGVMPGDESEATEAEIRAMAERVLRAALSPSKT